MRIAKEFEVNDRVVTQGIPREVMERVYALINKGIYAATTVALPNQNAKPETSGYVAGLFMQIADELTSEEQA